MHERLTFLFTTFAGYRVENAPIPVNNVSFDTATNADHSASAAQVPYSRHMLSFNERTQGGAWSAHDDGDSGNQQNRKAPAASPQRNQPAAARVMVPANATVLPIQFDVDTTSTMTDDPTGRRSSAFKQQIPGFPRISPAKKALGAYEWYDRDPYPSETKRQQKPVIVEDALSKLGHSRKRFLEVTSSQSFK
jgi:hypothetical protein